jgi:hypothetical protein
MLASLSGDGILHAFSLPMTVVLGKPPDLLGQCLRYFSQVERPGIPQVDMGMSRTQLGQGLWNFGFRMRSTRRKHGRRHDDLRRALPDQLFHGFF